jgi:hypothetical protein
LHGACFADLQIRERTDSVVDRNARVVEDFLELDAGFAALATC